MVCIISSKLITMRFFYSLIFLLVGLTNVFAQNSAIKLKLLTTNEVTKIFSDSLRQRFGIRLPVIKVYEYSDNTGHYYCLLTESEDEITNGNDTLNQKIKAISLKNESGLFTKLWQINDQTNKTKKQENSIWFWTKYIDFKDYNNDGIIDPIIIYGTAGENGYDDGRINVIIFYLGQKIVIKHQNGVLDFERNTQIDKSFYALPQDLQLVVKQKIKLMIENKQAVFINDWESNLSHNRTRF